MRPFPPAAEPPAAAASAKDVQEMARGLKSKATASAPSAAAANGRLEQFLASSSSRASQRPETKPVKKNKLKQAEGQADGPPPKKRKSQLRKDS